MVIAITNQMDAAEVLKTVLPFYPSIEYGDPLKDMPAEELLLEGHLIQRSPSDGFIDFHHIKLVTSNAKQMSKFFQITMGFEEIGYRGLETGSRILASHVIRNGKVTIELVNVLHPVVSNPSQYPCPSDGAYQRPHDFFEEVLSAFGFLVDDKLEENLVVDGATKEMIYDFIHLSSQYGQFVEKLGDIVHILRNMSTDTIQDMMDSSLISNYLTVHGDGVMDVSFEVTDVDTIFNKAVTAGAYILKPPRIISDKFGRVKVATINIPNTDMNHTLVENIDYTGEFLPGYYASENIYERPIEIELVCFDHCVENYSWNQMMPQARFYANIFGFHKYWSVDDTEIQTENSSLNSFVIASSNGKIKMPINEPSRGSMKGQIEEFNDYNGGPGVQHVALKTYDIIATVYNMQRNGIQFNTVNPSYYETLKKRLEEDDVILKENFDDLKSLNILVDYDVTSRNPKTRYCNYILQIFTNPLHDRPTFFIEIIQRHHHNGFGKGTFKGLYETIELEQKKRGNLVPSQ